MMKNIKEALACLNFKGANEHDGVKAFYNMDGSVKPVVDSGVSLASNSNNKPAGSTTNTFRAFSDTLGPIIPSPTASYDELYVPYYKVLSNLPKIQTDRLVIRKAQLSDTDDIYGYSKDARVAEHVLWSAHTSPLQTKNYIRYLIRLYKQGDPASMVISLKDTGRAIGTIGFMSINYDHSSAEIGYSLARDMWNKGIMTEALFAMVDFGFSKLRINRIEAMHELQNPSSGRVLEKVGFNCEGILYKKMYNKNKFVDVKLYAILYENYMNRGKL